MCSVLVSGNSQPRSSEDSIGDAMPTDSSSGSASANVIDIGCIVIRTININITIIECKSF